MRLSSHFGGMSITWGSMKRALIRPSTPTTNVAGIGLTTMVKQPDAARALVNNLSLPDSVPVIKKNGMDLA
jgi:hypothetical protein